MIATNFKKRISTLLVTFTTVCALMFALSGCSTLSPEQRAARAAQKELEARQKAAEHARIVEAFKNMDFVLEANRLTFRHGETVNVPSSINFISAVNGKVTVQLGSYRGVGVNGVGGITVEGNASDVTFKTNKSGIVELSMNVSGIGISAQVNIKLYGESNMATAIVQPNLSGNKITLNGSLRPASESNVYKGSSL